MIRSTLFAGALALASLAACAQTPAPVPTAVEAPLAGEKLVVFIKTDAIRQVGMGLHMARSAATKGADVTVIFGADGVIFPQRTGDQDVFEATGELPRKMIADIVAAGADVYVCKLCTIWLDLGDDDFLPGVEIVKSMTIFDALFADGARSLEF